MGLKNRVKQAAKAPAEVIDDITRMGVIGSAIKRAGVFSERNAQAVKTVGEDARGILRR